jgi:hypothetical protein
VLPGRYRSIGKLNALYTEAFCTKRSSIHKALVFEYIMGEDIDKLERVRHGKGELTSFKLVALLRFALDG